MEQSMEYLTNLYLVFVDFEKGSNSINRNKLWEVMNTCQVVHEGKLYHIIAIIPE
jgi:hypothetical protein